MHPFALLAFALPVVLAQNYHVKNNCPTAINLFIGGSPNRAVLQAGGQLTYSSANAPGFFYTDANGGNANGAGTTRAGFYGPSSYYYIVKDPNHFNVGVSITSENHTPANGFCGAAQCNDASCTAAYSSPPTSFPAHSVSTPPAQPLFQCDGTSVFAITFCPTGSFPPTNGVAIHPNGNNNKCLDVKGAVFANGTPVQIYDCNGTPAQKWIFNRASTKVQLAGTNFCLDAGSSPANGIGMKIWQCFTGLAAQQWYYTDDNRIALQGQGLCLDLDLGITTNGHKVQTWQCTDFNTNQIWTT